MAHVSNVFALKSLRQAHIYMLQYIYNTYAHHMCNNTFLLVQIYQAGEKIEYVTFWFRTCVAHLKRQGI